MKIIEKIKKYFGQIKNTKLLVIIFIVGIVLIIFPNGSMTKKKEVVEQKDCVLSYKEDLEKQLKTVLSSVKGVGNTDVMIVLENDGQTYFAADETSDIQEKDNAKQRVGEKIYVLKNDAGGGESPVTLKKNMPAVSGVLVIATGAKDVGVKSEIISAVHALLGVKAHRVEVLERK